MTKRWKGYSWRLVFILFASTFYERRVLLLFIWKGLFWNLSLSTLQVF